MEPSQRILKFRKRKIKTDLCVCVNSKLLFNVRNRHAFFSLVYSLQQTCVHYLSECYELSLG